MHTILYMDNEQRRQALGETIKNLRLSQGLSQRKLALMAGTNQSYLWQIENGQVNIGFDTLCDIASALGVPVRELVTF